MILSNISKINIIICSIFWCGVISPDCFANAKYTVDQANNANNLSNQTSYYDKSICIKLEESAPEDLIDQRKAAFKILKPLLTKNVSIAEVIWQKDVSMFGKKASISNVYITDFLNKKINEEKFVGYINVELVEPLPFRKNIVKSAIFTDVSYENIAAAAKLRENADIYRILGNNDSALRIYKQVIKLNPNDYISMYWIGEIYKNLHNDVSAKKYFSKALGYSPDFKSADDALYEIIQKEENY